MTSELVMNRRIVWDKCNKKQVEQAKKDLMGYKRKGYRLERNDGTEVTKFSPILEEVIVMVKEIAKSVMKILSPKGDERLVWDQDNGPEAKEAKSKFKELIKKGYSAFSVDHESKKNRKITEFDVEAEEILMVPATVKG